MSGKSVWALAARGVLVGLTACSSGIGWAQQADAVVATTPAAVSTAPAGRGIKSDDCSQAFHAALHDIGRRHVSAMREALTGARRPEPGATGKWLFGPPARRDKSNARTRAIATSSADPSRSEQALLRHADPLVKAKGQIALLHASTPLGGVVSRTTRELEAYTGQPPHHALCTGAAEMSEHLARQAAHIERQIKAWPLSSGGSKALIAILAARPHTKGDAGSPAPATTSSHIVTAALVADGQAGSVRPLKELIADVARIALPTEDAETVVARETPIAALSMLHDARGRRGRPLASESERARITEVLGVFEAAAYVAHATDVVSGLRDGLSAAVVAIREAHTRHCVCTTIGRRQPEPQSASGTSATLRSERTLETSTTKDAAETSGR